MLPDKVLAELAPILFGARVGTLQSYYALFVQGPLKARWTSDVASIQSLMDFKYYTEDTWALHIKAYGVEPTALEVPFEKLLRAIKATSETRRRQALTVAFLEEHALLLRTIVGPNRLAADFVRFSIEKELEAFFATGSKIAKYVPLLKSPRDAIETIANEMESTDAVTVSGLQTWASALGATSLWPVLALWSSSKQGTIDETFLHAPLPRIFGAPSCVRNAVDRQSAPERLVKSSTVAHSAFDIGRAILSGNGQLAYRATAASSTADWTIVEASRAHLVARIPGVTGRCVWALKPETREAAIYQLEPVWKTLAEFELPIDEVEGHPNWIDCQRDTEGSIWLLWGRINPLTGALYTQHTAAFDEDALHSEAFEFLESPSGEVPNRRSRGARIDYRDHGNLLSVHHEVHDDNTATERRWTHSFDVVFGNHLLMTLKTDSRPVEAIYGSPLQMILLSPLSSSALQEWRLVDGAATAGTDGTVSAGTEGASGSTAAKEYKLVKSEKVPKTANGWTSITVA